MKKQYVLDIYGTEFAVLNGYYKNGVEWHSNLKRASLNYQKIKSRVDALSSFILDTEIITHQVFRWADSVRIIISCKKRDMQRFIDYANADLHGMYFVIKRKPYSKRNYICLEDIDEENISTET